MSFKDKISKKGIKLVWLSKELGINYNSLRVYLFDESKMPLEVEDKLRKFLA